MNKLLCIVTLVFTSLNCLAGSSSLCEGIEWKIDPDMQIPESVFVKEEADKANAELLELGYEKDDLLTKFAIENRNRIIKGYELKERALDLKTEEAINKYCTFLANEAFYHD